MKKSKNFSIGEFKGFRSSVLEKTGYYFKKGYLLVQAFTQSSYSQRFGGENNEAFILFGDKILEYYVLKIMAERYDYTRTQKNISFNGDCEYSFEGYKKDFMELKKRIVSNEMLAQKIDEWELDKYLIVGKCYTDNQITNQEKIKADLFKAILGAIAVESKWNQKMLQNTVEKMLQIDNYLTESDKCKYRLENYTVDNAINTLKNLAEYGQCSVPVYEYSSPDNLGYDEDGNPRWVCTCSVESWALIRQVWASSKMLAKKYVAYLVLCEHFELPNEFGTSQALINWKFKDGKLSPLYKELEQ